MNGTNKRGRGRPHGTGLNDEKTLGQIAGHMVRNASLRPTTAIKRVLRNPDSATIRRLQVKWKAQGEDFLAKARERREAEAAARPVSEGINYGKLAMATGALRDAGGPSAIFDALNSPSLRAMRDVMESPAMRAIQQVENNPAMRLAREMDKIPGLRLMRELQNSPEMRIMREMAEMTRLTRGY
ncbi:hypothetical protein JQK15_26180 [Sphingobium sp. BHU LFT2]|uniref:hypothetical protein n=1 Tax=Sphingobium sp. BHU LFT2 TaxID=2807634 RepID=UPI001BE77316|nr:hypothetical protein [Sphingobium sp. BHU LFT2]MBT2246986.1 hypothetical protein [Sphingobium sp. BHU LFT2]